MLKTIEKHPYLTVSGILLAGVALWLLSSAGSSGVQTTGVDATSVEAATALQQTQMQVQAQQSQLSAQLQAQSENDASAQALAQIQGKYGFDVANLTANVDLANINAQAQTVALQSSLSAQTQQKAIDASVTQSQIQANESVQNTSTLATALVQQSTNQVNAILGSQQIQAGVLNNEIQAQKDCSGFIASIIGC